MKNYDLEKRRLVLSAVAIGIVVIYIHVVLSLIGMVSCWFLISRLMTLWW